MWDQVYPSSSVRNATELSCSVVSEFSSGPSPVELIYLFSRLAEVQCLDIYPARVFNYLFRTKGTFKVLFVLCLLALHHRITSPTSAIFRSETVRNK